MGIQAMGIRATCDRCGEIAVAASANDLTSRVGWRVTRTKGKGIEAYCTQACERDALDEQLKPQQTSMDDVLHNAEMEGRATLPDPPQDAPPVEPKADDIPEAFRQMDETNDAPPAE